MTVNRNDCDKNYVGMTNVNNRLNMTDRFSEKLIPEAYFNIIFHIDRPNYMFVFH